MGEKRERANAAEWAQRDYERGVESGRAIEHLKQLNAWRAWADAKRREEDAA